MTLRGSIALLTVAARPPPPDGPRCRCGAPMPVRYAHGATHVCRGCGVQTIRYQHLD